MAAPKRTPSERAPLPCGSTWAESIVVTGELPNGFGDHYRHTITPAITKLPARPGHRDADELQARVALAKRLTSVRWTLAARSKFLTATQQNLANKRLNEAASALLQIVDVYTKWLHRKGGAFPLPLPDFSFSMDARCDQPGAVFKVGIDTYGCPTSNELLVERPKDRKRIGDLIKAAAMSLRCAEWYIWRTSLYAQAKKADQAPSIGTPKPKPKPPASVGTGGMGIYVPQDPIPPTPKPPVEIDPDLLPDPQEPFDVAPDTPPDVPPEADPGPQPEFPKVPGEDGNPPTDDALPASGGLAIAVLGALGLFLFSRF